MACESMRAAAPVAEPEAAPPTLEVVDGFYPYPDLMREIGLRSELYVPRHYAGHRSRTPFIPADAVERIKAAFGFADIALHNVRERSGHFYVSPRRGAYRDSFFAHYDLNPDGGRAAYSLVIYLTPGAPRDSGTGLYRHRETGFWRYPTAAEARRAGTSRAALLRRFAEDGDDRRAWEELGRADNVYNRAVLFRADCYHSSLREFGGRPEEAKLYQAFFFHGTRARAPRAMVAAP